MAFTEPVIHAHELFLKMLLWGPSKAGKTHSALAIACAIGERIGKPVAVIDADDGGVDKKSVYFRFMRERVGPPYDPRFIYGGDPPAGQKRRNYIQEAINDGFGVLVIDNMSAFWNMEGGFQDIIDQIAAYEARGGKKRDTFSAWKKGNVFYYEMVRAIKTAPIHIILTARSSNDYEEVEKENGGTTRKRVGYKPEFRPNFEYEVDVEGVLTPEHVMTIAGARDDALDGKSWKRPGKDFAKAALDWYASLVRQGAKAAPARQPPPEAVEYEGPPAERPAPPAEQPHPPAERQAPQGPIMVSPPPPKHPGVSAKLQANEGFQKFSQRLAECVDVDTIDRLVRKVEQSTSQKPGPLANEFAEVARRLADERRKQLVRAAPAPAEEDFGDFGDDQEDRDAAADRRLVVSEPAAEVAHLPQNDGSTHEALANLEGEAFELFAKCVTEADVAAVRDDVASRGPLPVEVADRISGLHAGTLARVLFTSVQTRKELKAADDKLLDILGDNWSDEQTEAVSAQRRAAESRLPRTGGVRNQPNGPQPSA